MPKHQNQQPPRRSRAGAAESVHIWHIYGNANGTLPVPPTSLLLPSPPSSSSLLSAEANNVESHGHDSSFQLGRNLIHLDLKVKTCGVARDWP